MANTWEKVEALTDFILLVSKINAEYDCSHEIKSFLEENYDKPRQHIKKQRYYFVGKAKMN